MVEKYPRRSRNLWCKINNRCTSFEPRRTKDKQTNKQANKYEEEEENEMKQGRHEKMEHGKRGAKSDMTSKQKGRQTDMLREYTIHLKWVDSEICDSPIPKDRFSMFCRMIKKCYSQILCRGSGKIFRFWLFYIDLVIFVDRITNCIVNYQIR